MDLTPNEAEEALAAIQKMTQKTRKAIANSGAYIFLIVTGAIWLIGFLSTQFLPAKITIYIWIISSFIGSAVAILLGRRKDRRVRGASTNLYAKRAGTFWLLLILYCIAIVAIIRPTDGKQITTLIIVFTMLGQLSMGMLLSFSEVWWALPITALALVGYFLLPGIFYLWMAILVGGTMIGLGLYIRFRW